MHANQTEALVDYYNRVTIKKFTDLWITNTLFNYQLIQNSEGLRSYKDRHAGETAVCVGAGPSLNKNIHDLKEINALIIAAETVLPLFEKEGIVPDYVAVNDPSEKIAAHFGGVDTSDLTLVAPYFVHPKVLQCFRGKLVFYCPIANVHVFRLAEHALGDIGNLYSGSCVGHTLNYLAHYFGCSRIINVGQDLSYPNNARYANELREVDENNGGRRVSVEDIYGKPVISDERMLSYKHVFETTVPYFCDGVQFVNATEGGVLRLGDIMSLQAAKERFGL